MVSWCSERAGYRGPHQQLRQPGRGRAGAGLPLSCRRGGRG